MHKKSKLRQLILFYITIPHTVQAQYACMHAPLFFFFETETFKSPPFFDPGSASYHFVLAYLPTTA